jgi:NAD(P)-dependent dehydrogenase (short-subunit alcohol dehydrogenase family)
MKNQVKLSREEKEIMAKYVIIAASSGIGQALVSLLKKNGHHVFTTARNNSRINPDAYLDATDFEAVEEIFQKAGEIQGVVNCCGSLLLKPAHLTTKQEFENTLNCSLMTAFATVRAAAKYMPQGGSVVLISSAAAIRGLANHEAIAAAKAGVVGLTLSAAATYASRNLRFNAVAPGLINTPLTSNIFSHESSRKMSESMHALGRLGTAEDVARAIAFLIDPENDWITGQVLAVDGGLSSIAPRLKN